ncbi:MAG TPA: hypothetical protein VGD42_03340 [Lysobacter sp.]
MGNDADLSFATLPFTASNRPALPRIDYAADDLASLRARLRQRLPAALPGWNPALADGGDYATVLLDLFAQLGAILNGYADQRANEGFLRTAGLQRSLIDLCALIDYRLGSGASAIALQAFIAKPGKSGTLPIGFQLHAPPLPFSTDRAELVFETLAALEVHAARNQMRLLGYDRSSRVLQLRAASGATQDVAATMDGVYAGLKAGAPIVFDDSATLTAVPLVAAAEQQGATHLRWAAGAAKVDRDLAIADLQVWGRARQIMKLAAAERADEIQLGQNTLPVVNAAMFTVGSAVLVDSAGLQLPALVLAKNAAAKTITLNRGVVTSLRRSATRVLEGTACGATTGSIRAGATVLTRDPTTKKKDFPHTPAPGDLLLLADASGVELASVASASGATITLTQPIARALRPVKQPFDDEARVRYYSIALNDPATHQTALRPLLLGELGGVFQGGHTVLALDKAYDGLTPQTVVALSDGLQAGALRVLRADSVDGKTVLTLDGVASSALRVAMLGVYGPFEHAMHVAGYDHAEAMLAAGLSQLDIVGAPPGLVPGLDLVVADDSNAEGARITQVQLLAGKTRIALARPLERAYALGDTRVYGNVVAVAHGASADAEVLGSGDPGAAPQRFGLRRPALAFVPDAAAPRGVAPAVEIWVGDERWTTVDTLAGSGPLDRHCMIEIDDRERASVVFGDGVHGAPPPSGRNNIVARYRVGHGMAANVATNAIARMPRAAPFLERAFNPVPASGGAEQEAPLSAKRQAAFRVRTLDRAVSLADHAHLALTFAGIAKARADLEREGTGAAARRVIVVTCAAAGGNALSLPQKDALLAFLAARSVEPTRLRVRDHRAWPVRLALQVNVAANHAQAAVQRALMATFGAQPATDGSGGFFAFDRRELGTDLALSEVYLAAEATVGVDHVLATLFHREGATPQVADRIVVPADALATGGDASAADIGRLSLQLVGGLT